MGNRLRHLRAQVAREAALLLYTEQEKEYKQAKRRAAKTLGARILPSNLEVAQELDEAAEQNEGPSRKERLIQMRRDALRVMGVLQDFHPRLVGSVWRGTVHRNSDIDIVTFSPNPESVLMKLKESGLQIAKAEWRSVTKQGRRETSFHIHVALPSENEAEIVVRSPERMNQVEWCEIYGDHVTGLNYLQLYKVLNEDTLQRFVPTSR